MKRARGKDAAPTRIGIFLFDSGPPLRKNLDLRRLTARMEKFPGVVTVQANTLLADRKWKLSLSQSIREKRVNRVVIAAPSPWLWEESWRDCLEKAGLNRYLLVTADISAYARPTRPGRKAATGQVENILKAACRRASVLQAIARRAVKPVKKVLVMGAGLTGLNVTRRLAAAGYPVTLIEEREKAGGWLNDLPDFYQDSPFLYGGERLAPKAIIKSLAEEIQRHPRIEFCPLTSLSRARGQVGNFTVELRSPDKKWSDTFGAIVITSGMKARSPLPALKLKESPSVILFRQAPARIEELRQNRNPPRQLAFLLDTEEEQGAVTTGSALQLALQARQAGAGVTVFCRNVRVGDRGLEKLYRLSRLQGVLFVKYQKKPRIQTDDGRVTVTVFDEQMGKENAYPSDLLIVAESLTGDNEGIKKSLRLKGDAENFFQEENVWLCPTRSARRGIFLAGACREPSTVMQSLEEATAAAAEVAALLRPKFISFDLNTAAVDEDKCVFCLTCYRACPHRAIEMDSDQGVVRVSDSACQACGICSAECPAKAIQLNHYTDEQLQAEVETPPQFLIFACEQSGWKAGGAASDLGWTFPPGILMVRVPCAGKVDSALILSSLQKGAERVLVLSCHKENCHYLHGSTRASKRVGEIKKRLEEAGLDPERVTVGYLTSKDGAKFIKYVESVRYKV